MDFIGFMAGLVLGAAAVWFWAKARVASWKTLWEARGEELDKLAARADALDRENRELISGKQRAETELQTLHERVLHEGEERERHFQEQLRLVEEQLKNATREMLGQRTQELSRQNTEQMSAIINPLKGIEAIAGLIAKTMDHPINR